MSHRPFPLCLLLSLCCPAAFAARPHVAAVTTVDVDLATGAVRATGPDPNRAFLPGSTLKPLVLLTAMQHGVSTPATRVACRGDLRIAGRNLACAHPASLGVLDAEEALAYSCNTYVAQIARQMPAATLEQGLQHFGLPVKLMGDSPERRTLAALGLERTAVTPLQLARAYAVLARGLQATDPASRTVRAGLLGSVVYGMAHAAATPGVIVAGKTGTVDDPAPMLQHGWFAGIVFAPSPAAPPTHVVVVYAPGGGGNDAATAAHRLLQAMR